jgi:hypothetical protein
VKRAPELYSEKELSRLFGLIEHQLGKKGFFGSDTTAEYEEHKQALFKELAELEKNMAKLIKR